MLILPRNDKPANGMFIELCNLGIGIFSMASVATDGKDGHGLKALPKLQYSINKGARVAQW